MGKRRCLLSSRLTNSFLAALVCLLSVNSALAETEAVTPVLAPPVNLWSQLFVTVAPPGPLFGAYATAADLCAALSVIYSSSLRVGMLSDYQAVCSYRFKPTYRDLKPAPLDSPPRGPCLTMT